MSQPDGGEALGELLAFVNAAPVGLMQLSPDGRIELINAMAAQLLLPLSASRRLDNLFEVLATAAPGLRRQVAEAGPGQGPLGPGVRLQVQPGDAPASAAQWLSLQLLRLDARRVVAVLTDVTAAVLDEQALQATRELKAENRQMLATSRFKSQLLAMLSHEFRTPLNAIIGFADLMSTGRAATDPVRQATYLGHIRNSGRALLRLVNDMLDLSRPQAEGFDFVPQAVQPAELLKDVVDLLADDIVRKRLQVAVEVDPALGPLHLDPFRLRQVVFNVFGNAVKFTPTGGRVTLRARAEGAERVRIEVEDNGIGIAEADLPRLFSELQPLDMRDTRGHDGAGLGLALTRRLVLAQGGSVGVRSTLGQGSVFHLVLPRSHPGTGPTAPANGPG